MEKRLVRIRKGDMEFGLGERTIYYLSFECPRLTGVDFWGEVPQECIGHVMEYYVDGDRQILRDIESGKDYEGLIDWRSSCS